MTSVYKIRDKRGLFSHGVMLKDYKGKPYVKWSIKGKEWKTEKAVRDHLFKWITAVGIPDWEVVKVTYEPTKPLQDWFDSKMLVAILKQ
jgi:hypothetical protein